jgi:hypothetical protein
MSAQVPELSEIDVGLIVDVFRASETEFVYSMLFKSKFSCG